MSVKINNAEYFKHFSAMILPKFVNCGIIYFRMEFKIQSAYQPTGDQPQAIAELSRGIRAGFDYQP
jgi:hypothetical protein